MLDSLRKFSRNGHVCVCVCLPLSCDTLVSFNISIDALAFVTVHNGNGKISLKPVFIHMHRSIDKLTLFALLLLLLLLRSILGCPDFSRLHQTLKYKLSRHTLPIELYNFLRQKDSPFYADSRWNFNQNNLMDFVFFAKFTAVPPVPKAVHLIRIWWVLYL